MNNYLNQINNKKNFLENKITYMLKQERSWNPAKKKIKDSIKIKSKKILLLF